MQNVLFGEKKLNVFLNFSKHFSDSEFKINSR